MSLSYLMTFDTVCKILNYLLLTNVEITTSDLAQFSHYFIKKRWKMVCFYQGIYQGAYLFGMNYNSLRILWLSFFIFLKKKKKCYK